MQTLWTRTLRTRYSCRCRQCASYSTIVARRAATAVASASRSAAGSRLPALPSSTILYSAIFAVAAVADGRSKQQRRDQWNAAIQNAKDQLNKPHDELEAGGGELDEAGEPLVKKEQRDARTGLGPGHESLNEGGNISGQGDFGSVHYSDEILHSSVALDANELPEIPESSEGRDESTLWDDAQEYTMESNTRPPWPVNFGPALVPEHLPPQSIYAPDERKIQGLRSLWTRRKMQTMNLCTAKMATDLMMEAKMYKLPGTTAPRVPLEKLPPSLHPIAKLDICQLRDKLFRINQRLHDTKALHRDHQNLIPEYPPEFGLYPSYHQDESGDFHYKSHRMNKAIFRFFDACVKGEIEFENLIADVCNKILASSAPPNITTFNALLLGFMRLKKPKMSNIVIKAMHVTHMRPDEITCSAILRHHIALGQPQHFTRFMDRMLGQGDASTALMLARPNLHPNNFARQVGRVVPHAYSPEKLVQKVYPTPQVFNAVVTGSLKFTDLDHAIDICAQLAQEGWGLDEAGLTLFLGAAAENKNWEAGDAVWKQIQLLREMMPAGARLDSRTYLKMLGLCWQCGRQDEFAIVFNEAVEIGYNKQALLKDFDRMKRRGLDVFDGRIERQDAHALGRDLVRKLQAEEQLVETRAKERAEEKALAQAKALEEAQTQAEVQALEEAKANEEARALRKAKWRKKTPDDDPVSKWADGQWMATESRHADNIVSAPESESTAPAAEVLKPQQQPTPRNFVLPTEQPLVRYVQIQRERRDAQDAQAQLKQATDPAQQAAIRLAMVEKAARAQELRRQRAKAQQEAALTRQNAYMEWIERETAKRDRQRANALKRHAAAKAAIAKQAGFARRKRHENSLRRKGRLLMSPVRAVEPGAEEQYQRAKDRPVPVNIRQKVPRVWGFRLARRVRSPLERARLDSWWKGWLIAKNRGRSALKKAERWEREREAKKQQKALEADAAPESRRPPGAGER